MRLHSGKDQTPPKRELKVSDPKVRDLSLVELQLAPSSVLLLRFEKDELNGEWDSRLTHQVRVSSDIFSLIWTVSDIPAPLDPAILARAEDFPLPPDFELDAMSVAAATTTAAPTSSATPGSNTSEGPVKKTETKVPKWLKLSSMSLQVDVLRSCGVNNSICSEK